MKVKWPEGKDFAFTVFDDTDLSTLDNVKEVYSLLQDTGLRTTKSVWPIRVDGNPPIGGSTCEEDDYRAWVACLKEKGFEIGLHNVSYLSVERDIIIKGIEKFVDYFGEYPKVLAYHADNIENLYWGAERLTGINKRIYSLLTRGRYDGVFRGHIMGDKYFWGDICKSRVKYVRNFVFAEMDTLKICPFMPYHDPQRPFVNYYFASSEGANIRTFNQCISERNQDQLEEEGGACIMYTHFANGFYEDGSINARFRELIERIGRKKGWFVPVSVLLDYLLSVKGHHDIKEEERKRLERKWLLHKIMVGGT